MAKLPSASNNFVEQFGDQNPFDGFDFDLTPRPTLVDFDKDGDLDLFVGEGYSIRFLENVGSAVQAEFVERTGEANPFNGVVIDVGVSSPTLADLDGDGQIDTAVVGATSAGTLQYFSYDGGQFIEQTGEHNPFAEVTVGVSSNSTFVDLDGDSRLDLVVGDNDGLRFFRNDGAGFIEQTGDDNPLGDIDVGVGSFVSHQTFQDVDGDGDVDTVMYVADQSFRYLFRYFENTGSAAAPQFVERVGTDNPFDGMSNSGRALTLGDLDDDGDLDAIIGRRNNPLAYFANAPSVSLSIDCITPSEAGDVGAFIVTSSEPVPAGGLTIQYTVEAGDYAATAGVDYQPLSGEVTIAAGETTARIDLVVLDDPAFDPLELVTLTLSPPAGYLVPADKATAYLAIEDNESNSSLASALNEPNFKDQWHLWNTSLNRGTPGMDLNLLRVWQDYSGQGVKVGIVDSGVDADHPDLAANYDPGPNPDVSDDAMGHGTAVAGIVAAEAGNALGGVGIAYGASITSFVPDWVGSDSFGTEEDLFKAQMAMDVSNNSWGDKFFQMNFGDPDYRDEGKIIQEVVAKGRDGLGTVYVFAAGNSRGAKDTANYSNLTNSRHTIAVAALTADGVHTSYSNPGSSLLISAFGSRRAVFTTDIVGEAGSELGDYTFGFDGTSAAAPMVSGVVALMLEANPNLGYRDVQEILAYSARWNDADNASWAINNANNWNGGGLRHSADYGFGLVDALAAVRLAETWQTQHTAANEQKISRTSAATLAIPDAESSGIRDTIRVAKGLKLDYVEVDIDINHANYGDLIITLTSPTGLVSELVNRIPRGSESSDFGYDPDKVDGQDFTFTFSTTAAWGETGVGDWTLTVTDAETGDTGVLKDWTLNLYGDALTPDDTYIYTNDFAHANLKDDANRQILSDVNGGYDILNAAAVTSDLHLNLKGGETSRIAGKTLRIQEGSLIEQAFGGDGDDYLLGNHADNTLHGGRGDDLLNGGLGANTLTGGEGKDIFAFSRLKHTFDIITDFEMSRDLIDVSRLIKGDGDDDGDHDFEFEDHFKFVQQGSSAQIRINPLGDDDGMFKTLAVLDNIDAHQLSAEQFIV